MKEKIDKILTKLNFFLIIILVISVPVTFFINYFSLYHFQSSFTFKVHQVLTIILPIEMFIYFYRLFTRKIRMNIFDLLILLLILFGIISTAYALDLNTALWGSRYRFEGFIQIVTYYFLFLNSREFFKKDKCVSLINALIGMGLVQFLYSFLQVFIRGDYIFVKREFVSYRASGFVGHPNMLGSYTVLVLLLSLGMYLLHDKNKKFYLFSSIALYINLILTESTGPYFGFCFGLLFMLIFLKIKKKIDFKKIGIIIACAIILLFGVSCTTEYISEKYYNEKYMDEFSIRGDIVDTFSVLTRLIINDDSLFKDSEEVPNMSDLELYGSDRIWLWKRSILLIPKYFWTGTGIDNFSTAFSEVDNRHVALFDKAHNEYLHLLITQGIFVFITYMSLLVLIFINGVRYKGKNYLVMVLLFAIIGYAAQAFMNISVYNVSPFFFITMGLLVGITEEEKKGLLEK